ncbi:MULTISPECIES: hypothetical protein [unclassified Marinobacter]|jgi:hypothetical protein|uniref:hypothetical protein n=1 Tax=unclassified Marinobacter TaxID=83889 RepID=UPI00200DD3F4|nr:MULTISPECIES: hypothetical protein [unclassified Marinobacter]MCL1482098.1 hypothetical protein [Marinobacter sp.]MCL1487837.1 hypothetical protein [Marinobacter sp.]UQG56274.1 hypothetical protein MIH16_00940 [Marinobacter sp. M4C]UQG65078.1 hypothetical protein MIH17_00940 [Marinobacter sp. M2C]UQG69357.1 hypothetical protein MIH19_00940 [Marinobacter sp. M1C]
MEENECKFEYRVLSELPGGDTEIVYIPNKYPGVRRDGVMVKFLPKNGKPWVGIFAFGDMLPKGESQVLSGPGSKHFTIMAEGDAYIASPYNPESIVHVKSCPAIRAIPIPSRNLMLFHDYTELVAYNEKGIAWETERISWDGIEIDEVTDTKIIGKSWDAPTEKHVKFIVDLIDGSHKGGSSPPY